VSLYIWTEALGCAEILSPMLKSYVTHNDQPIHVYIYKEELHKLPVHHCIKPVVVSDNDEAGNMRSYISEGYKKGHLGTARLWAHIIKAQPHDYFIHLDADSIFLDNVISILANKVIHYGVVGSRRPYRHSATKRKLNLLPLLWMPDAVNTHCVAFKNIFENMQTEELTCLILARERGIIKKVFFPVIDFFDPLTFILRGKFGIFYLDSNTQARSGKYSRYGDFESRMISFAAVGSGCAFSKGTARSNSKSYEEFAMASYALYAKYLLHQDVGIKPLKSDYLEGLLMKLDTSTWTLSK
jgi:hypothetical protein